MDLSGISSYTDLLSSQISGSKTDSIKTSLSDASNKTDEELMSACKEFEAYFLEQVFKGMEKTIVKADNETSASSSTMLDYYKDELYSKLAKESTEQNGLGLAQQMYEQLKRNTAADTLFVNSSGQVSSATEEV